MSPRENDKVTKLPLSVGDIIRLRDGHCVRHDGKRFLISSDTYPLEPDDTRLYYAELNADLAGVYYVTHVDRNKSTDHYGCLQCDGWEISCERMSDGVKVDFFQGTGMTSAINDLVVIGRAECVWFPVSLDGQDAIVRLKREASGIRRGYLAGK